MFKLNRIDKLIESFADLGVSGVSYDIAMQISTKIQSLFFDDKFDNCMLIYNKFVSAITQKVTHQQIIPLNIKNEKENNNKEKKDNAIYIYEPDEVSILENLNISRFKKI